MSKQAGKSAEEEPSVAGASVPSACSHSLSTGDVDKLPGQLSSWLMAVESSAGEIVSTNLHLSLLENSSNGSRAFRHSK